MRASIFLLLVCCAPSTGVQEGVFTDLAVDEAAEKASAEGKLLIIDGWASWCAPCLRMDETTWADKSVASWLAEHAVVVKVDVDKQPRRAAELQIKVMPTVIVFRDDAELGRLRGFQRPTEFLAWLVVTASKGTSPGAERTAFEPLEEDPRPNPMTIGFEADALARTGRHDEALERYLWLWNHSLEYEPAYSGVRVSFLIGDISELAEVHEPTRTTFADLLRDLEERIRAGGATPSVWTDAIALTRVVDEPDRILEYYVIADERNEIEGLSNYVKSKFFDALMDKRLFLAAGTVFDDLVHRAEHVAETRAARQRVIAGSEELRALDTNVCDPGFIDKLSRLHVAALAAGKESDARGIGEMLREDQGDGFALPPLITMALDAGLGHAMHAEWLEQADAGLASAENLRERVAMAVSEGASR